MSPFARLRLGRGLFGFVLILPLLASGCAWMIKSATQPVLDNVVASVMKQRDLQLVKDGAPAYLIMIDGLLEGSPEDEDTLLAAAKLYTAYGSAFAEKPDQAEMMTARAREYAVRLMSLKNKTFARLHDKPAAEFGPAVKAMTVEDVEALLALINAWAAHLKFRSDRLASMADLPKLEALTARLIELDENYYYGSGHMIMGMLLSLRPAALGGRPDLARDHFEKALAISKRVYLPVQVAYAGGYARLVFDKELHDRLVKEVLNAPADKVPELTLINTVAKLQAARLAAEADEYF